MINLLWISLMHLFCSFCFLCKFWCYIKRKTFFDAPHVNRHLISALSCFSCCMLSIPPLSHSYHTAKSDLSAVNLSLAQHKPTTPVSVGRSAKTKQMSAFEETTQNSYFLLIFPFKALETRNDVGIYKFIPFLVPFSAQESWQHAYWWLEQSSLAYKTWMN